MNDLMHLKWTKCSVCFCEPKGCI